MQTSTVVTCFVAGFTMGCLVTPFLYGPDEEPMGFGTGSSIQYATRRRILSTTDGLDVVRSEEQDEDVKYDDHAFHKDNNSIADALYHKVKILCWIMTYPESKARQLAVKNTWGKRCNLLLFMSENDDHDLPAINMHVKSGREHLTAKTMHAFDHVYKYHTNSYDWFMKADDDSYVILENLRYMLSKHSPENLLYFGHHFSNRRKWADMPEGYFSGGAGYVVSRAALRKFGERPSDLCRKDGGAEDVEFGYCMAKLNVKPGNSRDALGRSRFHCFQPESFLTGKFPAWYPGYDKYGGPWGMANISDYAISFHYVSPKNMDMLEYFTYHLRPYGINSREQLLN